MQSIRVRLSRTMLAISFVWSIAVMGAVWLVVHDEVNELLDSALQESAQILSDLLAYNMQQLPIHDGRSAPMPTPAHVERLIWQVVDAQNVMQLHSHKAPDTPLLAIRTLGFADAGNNWRVFGMPLSGKNDWILYVAQENSERQEAGIEAAKYTAGTVLLIGLACLLWLRRRLRKELAPVARLSESIQRFDPLSNQSTLPLTNRSELQPMHQAITSLGARLAQRIANERAFSAHAAHALRTPLASMDAQLAVAIRESPFHMQPRLKRAREAANCLQRVVTALLTLFRSGSELHLKNISMRDLVAHIMIEGLTISTEGIDSIQVDPDLFAAALMNLLDNSVKHHASHVSINVKSNHRIVIVLQDNGEGIPKDKLMQLQAAIDAQDYSEKTGLGLMLADVVIRAHGGNLRLDSDTRGCAVEITIPAYENKNV